MIWSAEFSYHSVYGGNQNNKNYNKLIGYGRIIGDKTIFVYIHDVMVVPEYQGKNIGRGIMKELLKQVDEYKKVNPNIRTYLGASKNREGFYEKFGAKYMETLNNGEKLFYIEL